MSGAHTPGPWAADPTVAMHDRPDLPCVVDEYRLVVAQCWDDGHSEEECEANARLIASAPELLEALEAICRHADVLDRVALPIDRAEAAIAKAKARGAA